MMKRTLVAALMPLLIGLSTAQAAQIYNKDGNKLDFKARLTYCVIFPTIIATTVTPVMHV